MNNAGALAALIAAALVIVSVPRRLAVGPLLLTAAYTGRANIVEFGPANLSALRILILVAALRALIRGERVAGGLNAVDLFVGTWAVLLVGTSAFHTSDALTLRLGMVLSEVGVYFLCRVFIHTPDDVRTVFKMLSVGMLPLAGLLVLEKMTAHNFFASMGGPGGLVVRHDQVRAFGPFAHPILAGTVGATCVPMAIALWKTNRPHAFAGLASAAGIVYACTSSGPLMMIAFTLAAVALWIVRPFLGVIRLAAIGLVVALQLAMNDPVYFLMARIDLTGSSTGWHRAALVRASLEHLDEWWLAGTDYTRHWMATGIYANGNHTDITNHVLGMGVLGGLPLAGMFLAALACAFWRAGRHAQHTDDADAFLMWMLGATLFGHVMNFWSISLFDHAVAFFYLPLAAVGVEVGRRGAALKRRRAKQTSGVSVRHLPPYGRERSGGIPSHAVALTSRIERLDQADSVQSRALGCTPPHGGGSL